MKYNSPKKSTKPKKFKQGFQTKENGFERKRICRIPSNLSRVPQITMTQFQIILLDGRSDVCADTKHPWLLISDLVFLVGNQWLSLEVMQFFVSLINGIRRDTHIAF